MPTQTTPTDAPTEAPGTSATPAAHDATCPDHGTPMRYGRLPGEWFCGTGLGYEFEGPCNEQTADERAAGIKRWAEAAEPGAEQHG